MIFQKNYDNEPFREKVKQTFIEKIDGSYLADNKYVRINVSHPVGEMKNRSDNIVDVTT